MWSQTDKTEAIITETEDELSPHKSAKELDKDPFALDPCFETVEDLQQCLQAIGQQDVLITPDEVEVDIGGDHQERECICYKCEDIKITGSKDYLCCNQKFPTWKEDICSEE